MKKYVTIKNKKYWPSKEMKKIAWVTDPAIYQKAEKDPILFWETLAKEGLTWEKSWKKTYQEKLPYFYWFKGGKLNFSVNCLDRHLHKKDKTALIWVPEPVTEKTVRLTYGQLYEKVNKFAHVLKKLKIKKGDVVVIYLPLIPEALIAMLACTRIGAIHSVVFSAFSAEALHARIVDGEAKLVITCDGYYRRGNKENLIKKVNAAVKQTRVRKIIVVNRLGTKISGKKYLSFSKEIEQADSYCPPEPMNSEDMLFMLYTSGTTAKPKGIVHDTGGYAVQAYWTTKWNFNLHEDDVMWCTADIGWITGHTYAFYGPLLTGNTTLIYEGSPDFPDPGRWWKIIQDNAVSVFYTAPTALRMFIKFGDAWIKKYNLNSLKILGTVGEPIDEHTWNWYFKHIGKSRCPLIDTWWQTETGGTLINSLPGIGPFLPTIAGRSFPGTKHQVVNEKGKILSDGKQGYLVQLSPFAPGMLHGVYHNHKKYIETYWEKFKTKYDTDDGAYKKNMYFRITGRTDDVIKVAGHRLSTAELENALNKHILVNECAVVPMPDAIRGQVPISFTILKKGSPSAALEKKLKKHVDKMIGPTARPAKIYFVDDLPKTRSGKIMRRILRNILTAEEIKGVQTLVNPEIVKDIEELIRSKRQEYV